MSHPTPALTAPTNTRFRALVSMFALFTVIALAPAAYGQADLTFTGGSGAPLTTTLTRSVSYTVTGSNCGTGNGPFFDFVGVGNMLGFGQPVTGTISYSVNGGAAQAISFEESGFVGGNVAAADHTFYGLFPGLPSGSTVVLSLGSITTNNSIAGAAPTNGSYTTFITDGNGFRCSTDGVAIIPSSANVSVGGRVIAEYGMGLRNAQVSLTDAEGNTRMTTTSSFGYYRFDEVAPGETVFLTVRSKQYKFAPRVLTVEDSISDFDFTPSK